MYSYIVFSKVKGIVCKKGFGNFFRKGYDHEGDVVHGLKGAVATLLFLQLKAANIYRLLGKCGGLGICIVFIDCLSML
jgi:hypothetical protein